eukprot:11220530-Lingulodinium_polyedra.AAC.1
MEKTRAFDVSQPWYGCFIGGHIPEVSKAMCNDTWGLRQRLTVLFGEPLWSTIGEIRAACAVLP